MYHFLTSPTPGLVFQRGCSFPVGCGHVPEKGPDPCSPQKNLKAGNSHYPSLHDVNNMAIAKMDLSPFT